MGIVGSLVGRDEREGRRPLNEASVLLNTCRPGDREGEADAGAASPAWDGASAGAWDGASAGALAGAAAVSGGTFFELLLRVSAAGIEGRSAFKAFTDCCIRSPLDGEMSAAGLAKPEGSVGPPNRLREGKDALNAFFRRSRRGSGEANAARSNSSSWSIFFWPGWTARLTDRPTAERFDPLLQPTVRASGSRRSPYPGWPASTQNITTHLAQSVITATARRSPYVAQSVPLENSRPAAHAERDSPSHPQTHRLSPTDKTESEIS